MSKKSLVALAHGLDVQENVTRVFDMMGGAAKMIEPNSTVVLKPNAGHAAPPEFAVCTHPETVRAVIREVKKANPKRIVIAEAAAVGCDTDECYEACGIAAVAREEGVELVDIKKDKDLINVACGATAPTSATSSCPACCWRPSTSSTCPSSRPTPAWCSPAR